MVQRIEQHLAAAECRLLLLAVHLRDPERPTGQELRREVAERRDDRRLDQLDLLEEVALAGLDLVGLRVAVPGRPALQDVRYVHVGTGHPDLREQLLEQLARLADERQPLPVLVEARRLADEHQVGVRIAGAEHHLCTALREPAARAAGDGLGIALQVVCVLDRNGAHGCEDYA